MGLFSAGMKISKDASMKSYANIIVEQIVGMYDTDPDIHDNIPELTSSTTYSNGAYFSANSTDASTIAKPQVGDENWSLIEPKEAAAGSAISGSDSTINIYSTNTNGIFRIEFKSKLDSATIKDFELIARIWIEDDTGLTAIMSDDTTLIFDRILKVEISWPPNEPYTNRLLQGNVIYFQKDI